MRPDVELLLRVQHHDQKIKALEKEMAGIPMEEEDLRDRLVQEQKKIEAAKAALQRVEMDIKNFELDVQTRRNNIAKLKEQQYATRKNEEFQKLGLDIERNVKEVAGLEEREMVLLEASEVQSKLLAAARAAYAESEEGVKTEIEDLETLRNQLESDLAAEREARIGLAGKVEGGLLEIYDRVFKGKHGQAVVGLVDEVCQGCHMKVIKSTMIAVKSEESIATCENCGRFLYWWTDDKVGKNRGEY